MRFFAALVFVVALATVASAAPARDFDFAAAVVDAHAKLNAFHASLLPHMNGHTLQSVSVSPGCAAALGALAGVNAACADAPNFQASVNVTTETVAGYCSGACYNTRIQVIRSLASACSLADLGNVDPNATDPTATVDDLIFVTTLPCLTYQNQYCYPVFVNAIAELGLHGSDLTTLNLPVVCTPCLPFYLKIFSDFSARTGNPTSNIANFEFLSVICVTDNNRFCLPPFLNASTQLQAQQPGTLPPPPLVVLACDRCVFRVYSRLAILTESHQYAGFVKNYSLLCQRNAQNQLCWPLVAAATAPLAACSSYFLNRSCGNCSGLVANLISVGGCCANQVAQLAANSFGIDTVILEGILTAFCQLNPGFPAVCPLGTVTFRTILANLRYSFYQSNSADVLAKITADLAAEAGVDPSVVQITPSASGSGTAITATITTPSTQDASAVQVALQTAQLQGTLSFSSVASLPASSRVDPLANPDGSGSPTGSSSPASTLVPSGFTLLIMLLIIFA